MQDFCSVMPATKLSNFFLMSFTEIAVEQETAAQAGAGHTADPEIGLKLDVIIAIMEKVRLKKENYMQVMRSVKLFIDNKHT